MSRLAELAPAIPAQLGLDVAEQTAGGLAAEAIRRGMLIRGGAAVGQLHHRNGVIAGRAMNDAYEIESRLAHYPRIAVSPDLAAASEKSHLLKVDHDVTIFPRCCAC